MRGIPSIFRGLSALSGASPSTCLENTVRGLSTATDLKSALKDKISEQQERLKKLKKEHGRKELGAVTLDMTIRGMRGIPEKLPSAIPDGEPLPEGLLWLLLTGDVPSKDQPSAVTQELQQRSTLPEHLKKVLKSLPKDRHPMTQLSIAILALQRPSPRASTSWEPAYWEPVVEDSIDLTAKLPGIASLIYRNTYKNGNVVASDSNLDWTADLSHMMALSLTRCVDYAGYDDQGAQELMRMYQTIHTDHKGGNVSAHATHLVGSALTDPHFSLSAGINGLAGPCYGLANQEVLGWLSKCKKSLVMTLAVMDFANRTLKSGKVVPGYGHAVLRETDPRYSCQ
ncbi:TPA: hypothetical protein ACH3X3_004166 [Trebouxia sp. C0006]